MEPVVPGAGLARPYGAHCAAERSPQQRSGLTSRCGGCGVREDAGSSRLPAFPRTRAEARRPCSRTAPRPQVGAEAPRERYERALRPLGVRAGRQRPRAPPSRRMASDGGVNHPVCGDRGETSQKRRKRKWSSGNSHEISGVGATVQPAFCCGPGSLFLENDREKWWKLWERRLLGAGAASGAPLQMLAPRREAPEGDRLELAL